MVDTASSHAPDSVYVLGVRVDRQTRLQAIERIDQLILNQHAGQNQCQQVVTVNPEFVMMAQRDATFRLCINQAALVVPDGMGIVWATHLLGKPTPERVTGTDTLPELAWLCADK
ncbi:MAG: WecB/TagA/CpsF family glycosyltransferase, partial [Ktedonobacteraceae bacterium]|nr:WecB/TagA/CpsF family glycosyltransferase [Ktedonobacteraceae bacterium]